MIESTIFKIILIHIFAKSIETGKGCSFDNALKGSNKLFLNCIYLL
jgi:hypothetical protein